MDEFFQQLVKAGPGWTMIVLIGTFAGAVLFFAMNRQYRRMEGEAKAAMVKSHDEQLKLKEAANSDLRVRVAELEAEKNSLRERAHTSANDVQRLTVEVSELRNRPNVDSLVSVLKDLTRESAESRTAQTKFNVEFLAAIKLMNEDFRRLIPQPPQPA